MRTIYKIIGIITGAIALLFIPFMVYAVPVSVPSAPGANYVLLSTTTGNYLPVATSSLGISGGGTNYWSLSGSNLSNNSGTTVQVNNMLDVQTTATDNLTPNEFLYAQDSQSDPRVAFMQFGGDANGDIDEGSASADQFIFLTYNGNGSDVRFYPNVLRANGYQGFDNEKNIAFEATGNINGPSSMVIEGDNGNVGIGTGDADTDDQLPPQAQLHVKQTNNMGMGTISDDGSGNITGDGTFFTTKVAVGGILEDQGNGMTGTITSISDDNHLTLNTSIGGRSGELWSYTPPMFRVDDVDGNPHLLVDVNGNVGIDTPTPAYPLDVNGNINTNGCYMISGVCQTFGGSQTPWTSNINGGGYTLSNVASFNSLQLSMGHNSISGNVAVGQNALASGNSGSGYNVAVGTSALYNNTSGAYNMAIGGNSMIGNYTGTSNVGIGFGTLYALSAGSGNVAIGTGAVSSNDVSDNVAIGIRAGKYSAANNAFYVNNIDQSNTAGDQNYSLMYGKFSGTAGSLTGQFLDVNGRLGVNTTTPAYPLDVNGDVNTNGCYRVNGTCLSTGGTVTSVGLTVPTGLTVSNTPITTSGTTTIGLASGYVIPLTASTTQWNNFYNASTSLPYVTSVGLSSTNSTLTIGSTPVTTSGTITADLNLAHSNSWTGQQTFVNASSTNMSVSTNEWVGGGSVSSSYPFQVHTGTNDNFSVQPPISFTNGIRLRSEIDNNSSLEGMEFAANAFTFTGGGNVGIGGIASNDIFEVFGTASSSNFVANSTTATSTFADSIQATAGTILNNEYTPATSTTMTINWLNGTQQLIKLGTSAVTINFSGVVAGGVLRLPICQNATGGATTTWDSRVIWAATSTGGANVAPTLSAANHCDLMTFDATNGTSSLIIMGGYLNF